MPKTLEKNLEFWLWFIDKGFTLDTESVKILRGDLVQCLDLVNDIKRWNAHVYEQISEVRAELTDVEKGLRGSWVDGKYVSPETGDCPVCGKGVALCGDCVRRNCKRSAPTLQATAGFMDSAAQGGFNANPDSMRARHTSSRGWEHYVDGRWVQAEGPRVNERPKKPHDSSKWTGC